MEEDVPNINHQHKSDLSELKHQLENISQNCNVVDFNQRERVDSLQLQQHNNQSIPPANQNIIDISIEKSGVSVTKQEQKDIQSPNKKTKASTDTKEQNKSNIKEQQKQLEKINSSDKKNNSNTKQSQQSNPNKNPKSKLFQEASGFLNRAGKIMNFRTDKESINSAKQQYRMLVKVAFSKKKQNYHQLEQWDKARAEILGLNRAIIEQIQTEIDKRIKSSIQNLDIYCAFFREKAKQEEKYATHPIINTRFSTQNNQISKSIYINCSLLLNSLSDQNLQRAKKAQNFAFYIKKNILSDLIEQHVKGSQMQLLKIREKIFTLKSTLQKCNLQTQKKSTKLAAHFSHDLNNVSLDSQKDFYKQQLSFLRKAHQQTRIQKRWGQFIVEYMHTAVKQQIKRSGIIKKAIMMYTQGLRKAYEMEIDKETFQQLNKQQETKLVSQYYALQQILSSRTLELLREKIKGKHKELVLEDFEKFIEKFEFEDFDNRILILKEYSVGNQIGKDKIELCDMRITVDGFLQIFFNTQHTQKYVKPSVSFKINSSLSIVSKGDTKVEIKKKQEKKGVISYLIWQVKSEPGLLIRFHKKDTKEEFLDLIRKLVIV